MKKILFILILLICPLIYGHAIKEDEVDKTQIFYGNYKSFETPCELNYIDIVKNTKEYKKAIQCEVGSAKYYIYLENARYKAKNIIEEYLKNTKYDFATTIDYLDKFNIESIDITNDILKYMDEILV